MTFWLLFIAIQLVCFLPFYLANIRQQKNPLAFLTETRFWNSNKLKLLYSKQGFSDPFHFHFEFCVALCLFLLLGWRGDIATVVMALLLTAFQIEIIYTAVLTYIFSRPPVFRGDGPLIKSGWILWKENRHWIVLAVVMVIALLFSLNHWMSGNLLAAAPGSPWLLLILCSVLAVPAIYNWRSYDYTAFHFRTVYSTVLHCVRNVLFGRQFNILFQQNADFFDEKNVFKPVKLSESPDVVHVCIESYGAICFKDPDIQLRLSGLYQDFEEQLHEKGFHIASRFSTSPIFTGGSWLSYATFMYGFRFDNLQLYDGLFQYSDNFASYESVFHILKRNQYHNVLAAPLGGVDNQDVSWDTISRCFQPDTILDWESYDYKGPKLRFFNQEKTFCMPDQYALNQAYHKASEQAEDSPVSLFYCTMNSHVPYHSPTEVAQDWRQINSPEYQPKMLDTTQPVAERYLQAIEYQLQFVLSFVLENSHKDLIVTLFGDHQPPFVATESMGRETPVHVISKNPHFQQKLLAQGFHDTLAIPTDSAAMKHEAWLSMFTNAMNTVYGEDKSLSLPILTDGVDLFPEGRKQ